MTVATAQVPADRILAETDHPVEVYEAALGLYRGDLLDSTSVFNYRWMYSEDPQIGVMLRSDFRVDMTHGWPRANQSSANIERHCLNILE